MPVCPYIYMFTHILFIKHSFWWKSLVYILLSSSAKRLSVLEQCFFSWWRTIVFLNIQYVTDFQVVLSKLTSVHSYHVTHCTSSAMLELVCISFSEMAPLNTHLDVTAVWSCYTNCLTQSQFVSLWENCTLSGTLLEHFIFESINVNSNQVSLGKGNWHQRWTPRKYFLQDFILIFFQLSKIQAKNGICILYQFLGLPSKFGFYLEHKMWCVYSLLCVEVSREQVDYKLWINVT